MTKRQEKLGHFFLHRLAAILIGAGLVLALTAHRDPIRIPSEADKHKMVAAYADASESVQPAPVSLVRPIASEATGDAIIVDHSSTDITAVPQAWVDEAKRTLHIGYGHTSHGSQLVTGMAGLIDFANGGGLGLSLPPNIFQFSANGNDGGDYLHLFEGAGWDDGYLRGDVGYYPDWVYETRDYLGDPDPTTGRGENHPEMNVIIWSWCGQASTYTEQQMLDRYLLPMSELEEDYPGVTFVYMTGHADGTGEEGNLHQRNQQIRDYCVQNDKVLYDFYDIELYDPDGTYYGDKAVNGACDYDSDGDGAPDSIWCLEWQNAHTEGVDWYATDCAHSYPINCNQKAYAAWWLWARLAGWDGRTAASPDLTSSTKIADPVQAHFGEHVTYSISIRNSGTLLDATVHLTDVVPPELSYVDGSLTSTTGITSDDEAPTLRWTGVVSPTPVVTVTYATIVDTTESQLVGNNAVIDSAGYDPITISATIIANPYRQYLPMVLRDD